MQQGALTAPIRADQGRDFSGRDGQCRYRQSQGISVEKADVGQSIQIWHWMRNLTNGPSILSAFVDSMNRPLTGDADKGMHCRKKCCHCYDEVSLVSMLLKFRELIGFEYEKM